MVCPEPSESMDSPGQLVFSLTYLLLAGDSNGKVSDADFHFGPSLMISVGALLVHPVGGFIGQTHVLARLLVLETPPTLLP